MIQSPSPNTNSDSSADKTVTQIFVVGSKKLRNQLIASCLEQATGMQCIIGAGFSDITHTVRQNENGTNLLVLDYGEALSDNGLETVQHMFPDCIICLYNTEKNDVRLGKMLGTVRGLFSENDSIKLLTKGINAVISGRLWLPRKIMEDHILNPPDDQPKQTKPQLTPKETEILTIVSKGASNQEVSKKLGIKRRTVQSHLYYIYKKLGVSNRIQAALWANQNLST